MCLIRLLVQFLTLTRLRCAQSQIAKVSFCFTKQSSCILPPFSCCSLSLQFQLFSAHLLAVLLRLNYLKSLNLFIQNKKCKTETQCIKRSRAKAAFGPPLVANTCGQGAIFFKICCRRQTLAGIYFESFYFQASLTIMNPRFFQLLPKEALQFAIFTDYYSFELRFAINTQYTLLSSSFVFFLFFLFNRRRIA